MLFDARGEEMLPTLCANAEMFGSIYFYVEANFSTRYFVSFYSHRVIRGVLLLLNSMP
jgi:hypothetical protein